MIADRKVKRSDRLADDRTGKVFMMLSHDTRKCLVCEQVFTREVSRDHAKVACYPTKRTREAHEKG